MEADLTYNILFVDDEIRIIRGIKRMMFDMQSDWEMFFVTSGQEALEIFEREKIDVIVSDMRMPGMDGGELLSKIMDISPETIRIILSGFSEQEATLRTVKVAQQFISKPANGEILVSTVQRALDLRRLLRNESLERVIAGTENIFTNSKVHMDIIKELQRPDCSMTKLAELVSQDVIIVANILKMVNSAFFGLPKKIVNIQQAVSYLGINTILALFLHSELFSKANIRNDKIFSIDSFNEHSMKVAAFAKEIYVSYTGSSILADDIVIAGILHDIGKLLLLTIPGYYKNKNDENVTRVYRKPEDEYTILNSSHSEVGAYLLGLWGFKDNIVEAVAYHHNPSKMFGKKEFNMVSAIHIAEALIMNRNNLNYDDGENNLDMDYIKEIGVEDKIEKWERYFREYIENGDMNEQ